MSANKTPFVVGVGITRVDIVGIVLGAIGATIEDTKANVLGRPIDCGLSEKFCCTYTLTAEQYCKLNKLQSWMPECMRHCLVPNYIHIFETDRGALDFSDIIERATLKRPGGSL